MYGIIPVFIFEKFFLMDKLEMTTERLGIEEGFQAYVARQEFLRTDVFGVIVENLLPLLGDCYTAFRATERLFDGILDFLVLLLSTFCIGRRGYQLKSGTKVHP